MKYKGQASVLYSKQCYNVFSLFFWLGGEHTRNSLKLWKVILTTSITSEVTCNGRQIPPALKTSSAKSGLERWKSSVFKICKEERDNMALIHASQFSILTHKVLHYMMSNISLFIFQDWNTMINVCILDCISWPGKWNLMTSRIGKCNSCL